MRKHININSNKKTLLEICYYFFSRVLMVKCRSCIKNIWQCGILLLFFFLFPVVPHGVRGASTNSFHLPRSSLWNPSRVSEAHWFPLNLLLAPVWGISPMTRCPVESLTAYGPSLFLSFWVNSHIKVYSVLRRRVLAFAPSHIATGAYSNQHCHPATTMR
jgi:hypothetical protein